VLYCQKKSLLFTSFLHIAALFADWAGFEGYFAKNGRNKPMPRLIFAFL